MAVAAEVERRHTDAGGENAADLHKAMVEQALHGYDVQLSAVHFAATSLAMLNPEIQFDRMNLYVMQLGSEGSNVSLGRSTFLARTRPRFSSLYPPRRPVWPHKTPSACPAPVPAARRKV